jgi:hypothetical protein
MCCRLRYLYVSRAFLFVHVTLYEGYVTAALPTQHWSDDDFPILLQIPPLSLLYDAVALYDFWGIKITLYLCRNMRLTPKILRGYQVSRNSKEM